MDRGPKREMGLLFSRSVIIFLLFLLTGCAHPVVPDWVIWNEKTESLPVNPGLFEGEITLKDKQLSYQADHAVWNTDAEWLISDFLIDDIDLDGWPEVLVACWVKGQYGDAHPIWEDPQKKDYTQRLFVFDIKEDHLDAQWMSSEMKPQFRKWEVSDHTLVIEDLQGNASLWKWEGRGFVREE